MKPDWMGRDARAIAILRVSSHRQKDNISHETQEEEIRTYCKDAGLNLVHVFSIVESAKDSDERDKFQLAVKWATKGNARHVVFYMTDREGRNFTDIERHQKLIKKDTIVVHYAKDRRVLHKNSPHFEFTMRQFEAFRDKQFSEVISIKVGDAQRTKAEQGWYPGNRPPLGYKNKKQVVNGVEQKRGTEVIVDDKNAKVVLRMFELRAAGLSLDAIRSNIVSSGLLDPTRAGKFYKSHIEKILKNPFYAGRFTWQGQEYEGNHPVFVPRDLLHRVNGIKKGKRARIVLNEFNLFGHGFMTCALCGLDVVYERKKGRFHLYHCSNSRGLHSLKGQIISLDNIWRQMEASVERITLTASLAKALARAINEMDSTSTQALKRKVIALTEALEGFEKKEDELYDDFKSGVLDQVGHQRQLKRVRDQRAETAIELEKAKGAMAGSFRESAESLIELCRDAKSLWIKRSIWERREFLNCFQSNRRLNGVTIEIEMKKPFQIISEMASSREWRPQLDVLRTALVPTLDLVQGETPWSEP